MKRPIVLVILAFVSPIVVFLAALMTSDKTKYNNDFVRLFPPHAADQRSIMKIEPTRFNIAGAADNIYLWDRFGVLKVNYNLTDTMRVRLDSPRGSEILVDSPYFFIHYGPNGLLQRGRLSESDWEIDKTFSDFNGFTAIQPISSNTAVIRTIKLKNRENILVNPTTKHKYVLKKQVDGLLCTDGFLQYSKELNQLIYVYRYRNQFVCLDTTLTVLDFGKTIDTIAVAKIEVAEIDGKITMGKPPLKVNNDACVDGHYLFIQSNLIARNELVKNARERTVIDVYNLLDNSYRFSFYIDNYENSRVQAFKVKNLTLVALFNRAVITYDLPKQYLP